MTFHRIIGLAACLILLCAVENPILSQSRPRAHPLDDKFEPPTEQQALEDLEKISTLEQVNNEAVGIQLDYICNELTFAGQYAAESKSDTIVQAIINFPVHDPLVGETKILALISFNEMPSGVHDFIINSLHDPNVEARKAAIRVLVHWGMEWDKVFAVLKESGNYDVLINTPKNPEIESVLREGTKTSTWEGRIQAAFVLQYYGDTTTVIDVSEDIVHNSPINVEDKSLGRAKHTALGMLERYRVADIDGIARLCNDEIVLVRITAVDVLGTFARSGNQGAIASLEEVSRINQDFKLRATAAKTLEFIKNMEEK